MLLKPLRLSLLAAALVLSADIASAQTAAQPRSGAPAANAATTSGQSTTTARRPRSAAQLRNDQIMRDCGAEWRAGKARLQAAGKTWRTFLPECRARRVAASPSR